VSFAYYILSRALGDGLPSAQIDHLLTCPPEPWSSQCSNKPLPCRSTWATAVLVLK